jgi:predicted DNA binding protein
MVGDQAAAVIEMHGRDTHWQLRVLFPNRASLSSTSEFCADSGLTFTVRNVQDLQQSTGSGGFGLSTDQYETLVTAAEQGYFDVPRSVTMEQLADSLGISQQAVSERLRRGHRALVNSALRPDESTIGK